MFPGSKQGAFQEDSNLFGMIIGSFSGIVLLPNNLSLNNSFPGGFLMKLRHAVALTFLLIVTFASGYSQTPATPSQRHRPQLLRRGNTDIGLHLAARQACQGEGTV